MIAPIAAYLRHDVLTATSYRVRMVLSLGGLAAGAVPLYFIANALHPLMASKIQGQGEQYFSFVLIGLVANQFLLAAADGLPRAFHDGIRTGTLEALFATPTPLPVMLAGMMSFRFLWATLQAAVLVGVGMLLGARFAVDNIPAALFLLGLIGACYVPFGLLAGALLVSFRTTGPLLVIVGTGSALLGGVYYPTEVIPSWLGHLSTIVPLTYGARALRKTFLEGLGFEAVLGDVLVLLALLAVLLTASSLLFHKAVRYARRAGTLAQY